MLNLVSCCVGVKAAGHTVTNPLFFDTITVQAKGSIDTIRSRAAQKRINFRYGEGDEVRLCDNVAVYLYAMLTCLKA